MLVDIFSVEAVGQWMFVCFGGSRTARDFFVGKGKG